MQAKAPLRNPTFEPEAWAEKPQSGKSYVTPGLLLLYDAADLSVNDTIRFAKGNCGAFARKHSGESPIRVVLPPFS